LLLALSWNESMVQWNYAKVAPVLRFLKSRLGVAPQPDQLLNTTGWKRYGSVFSL